MKITYNLILFTLSLSCISCIEYHYITNDGTIHRAVDSNLDLLWNNGLNNTAVAVMSYENNINATGWANLELKSFDHFPDEMQSFLAGVLEAYITGELIEMHYKNIIGDHCRDEEEYVCHKIHEFYEINKLFIERMIAENKDNDYWHQIHLIYEQLRGLEHGYHVWKVDNNRTESDNQQIFPDILLMNLLGEFPGLRRTLDPGHYYTPGDHCSAIVKPLADGSDLFVAHNTWTSYRNMLRVMKRYSFGLNLKKGNKTARISGHSVAFSSFPGFIFSSDDYYVLSSGLVVQETELSIYNQSLFANIDPNDIVFEFVRNVVANRLANSGKEWTQLFGAYNSGTVSNEWMIVDYKLFNRGTPVSKLSDGLLWIIEQIPHHNRAEDVTHVLRAQGYWASYNIPYFKDIHRWTGFEDQFLIKGDYFSYEDTARAQIFRRDQPNVTDLKSLFTLMRYDDHTHDLLSRCSLYNMTCSPDYSSKLSIAMRGDMDDEHRRAFGAIDAKLINQTMVNSLEMFAVSGPTDRQQPAFQWSTIASKVAHVGQPDVWKFKPIYVKWYPKRYQIANDI